MTSFASVSWPTQKLRNSQSTSSVGESRECCLKISGCRSCYRRSGYYATGADIAAIGSACSLSELAEFAKVATPMFAFVVRDEQLHTPFGFTGGRRAYHFPNCVGEQVAVADPQAALNEPNRELAAWAESVHAWQGEKACLRGLEGFEPGRCRSSADPPVPAGSIVLDLMVYAQDVLAPGYPEAVPCLVDLRSRHAEVIPWWLVFGEEWCVPKPHEHAVDLAFELCLAHSSWNSAKVHMAAAGYDGHMAGDLITDTEAVLLTFWDDEKEFRLYPGTFPQDQGPLDQAIRQALIQYIQQSNAELEGARVSLEEIRDTPRSHLESAWAQPLQWALVIRLIRPDLDRDSLADYLCDMGLSPKRANEVSFLAMDWAPDPVTCANSATCRSPLRTAEELLAMDHTPSEVATRLAREGAMFWTRQEVASASCQILGHEFESPPPRLASVIQGLLPALTACLEVADYEGAEALCLAAGISREQTRLNLVTLLHAYGFPWKSAIGEECS